MLHATKKKIEFLLGSLITKINSGQTDAQRSDISQYSPTGAEAFMKVGKTAFPALLILNSGGFRSARMNSVLAFAYEFMAETKPSRGRQIPLGRLLPDQPLHRNEFTSFIVTFDRSREGTYGRKNAYFVFIQSLHTSVRKSNLMSNNDTGLNCHNSICFSILSQYLQYYFHMRKKYNLFALLELIEA